MSAVLVSFGLSLEKWQLAQVAELQKAIPWKEALLRNKEKMLQVFSDWDADKSGGVDKTEFRRGIMLMKVHAKRTEVNAMFDAIDIDGDGIVSYEELDQWLDRVRRHHEKSKRLLDHRDENSAPPAAIRTSSPDPDPDEESGLKVDVSAHGQRDGTSASGRRDGKRPTELFTPDLTPSPGSITTKALMHGSGGDDGGVDGGGGASGGQRLFGKMQSWKPPSSLPTMPNPSGERPNVVTVDQMIENARQSTMTAMNSTKKMAKHATKKMVSAHEKTMSDAVRTMYATAATRDLDKTWVWQFKTFMLFPVISNLRYLDFVFRVLYPIAFLTFVILMYAQVDVDGHYAKLNTVPCYTSALNA